MQELEYQIDSINMSKANTLIGRITGILETLIACEIKTDEFNNFFKECHDYTFENGITLYKEYQGLRKGIYGAKEDIVASLSDELYRVYVTLPKKALPKQDMATFKKKLVSMGLKLEP